MSDQAFAPYERPALTKGYLFPLDKKPARLPVRVLCITPNVSTLRNLQFQRFSLLVLEFVI